MNTIRSVRDLSDTEIIKIMEGAQGQVGLNDALESQVVVNTGRCIVAPEPTLFDDIRNRYRELVEKKA